MSVSEYTIPKGLAEFVTRKQENLLIISLHFMTVSFVIEYLVHIPKMIL